MSSENTLTPAGSSDPASHASLDFPIVGIGASAGGIQALVRFFEHLPADPGMAFVVVVHLSPKHESHVDQIIQRATKLPTVQVNSTVNIEKNHIYVISPAVNLKMADGQLEVVSVGPSHIKQVVIDIFFRTLADAHEGRAIAIVLSGSGADGSLGMARIKEQGGVNLAQLPEDAEFDGMPRSAIESNVVDFVLPVVEMPQKLLDLWRNASRIKLPKDSEGYASGEQPTLEDDAHSAVASLAEVLRLLYVRTGHNFKHYKRATVLRRIERRLQVTGVADMSEYLSLLKEDVDETSALLGDMLIGVTNFFRDREAFEALERNVIPDIYKQARENDSPDIRVWVPACSTGEEAYSIAMVLTAEAELQASPAKVQIFATDVDEIAISVARRARYPESIVTDVPPVFLRHYFKTEGSRFQIVKRIRDQVLFAVHNLLRDPPFSRLHLVSCRNLLIYLDREAQKHVLNLLHSVLHPGGYLFLGTSETPDAAEGLFATVDKKNRIYRATKLSRSIRPALTDRLTPIAVISRRSTQETFTSQKAASYSIIHQRALEKYGPPTILVDTGFRIVHMSEPAGRFLRHVGGEPSNNVLFLVFPELRLDLRAAALEAMKTGRPSETRGVPFDRDGQSFEVKILVAPFNDKESIEALLLVMFDETAISDQSDVGSARHSKTEKLEDELRCLRAQLQQTIDYSDSSTEALKASNEEFQAVNEELRSATEELETSKEELESINEELTTVNVELKAKVEETVKINDDLQNLISSSDIATIFVDRAMRVKWFTPKTAALFSLIPDDKGRALTDITHRLDYPMMISDATEVFNTLGLIEREVRSNDNHWYLARILPYRTTADRIDGAILNFVDITKRRVAEDRLREGLERLRLVAESTKDFAIIAMDESGRITSWNKAAELIFGYTQAEIEGQPLDVLFTPEDRAEGVPAQELKTAKEHGHALDERWHIRKDGSRFFCSGMVYPMLDGDFRGYAKIARDLTDKRLAEHEQQSALERTKASNVLKDEFIAIMSHELRHPLNLIQLNMDLLARTPGVIGSASAANAIDAVRRSVRNQSQIIADLLDLSRVQTGKLKLERAPMALAPSVKAICEAVAAQAKEAQITLNAQGLQADGDALIVNGDVTRVEQIIWNLLNNAIKFTPSGGTVTVSLTREGDEARLDVQDTGIGIPADSLARVFTMFGQVDHKHRKHQQQGLGIGLALVAQLAEAHGGRVAVASAGEGQGSTFSLWLPIAREGAGDGEKPEPECTGMLNGIRLLLVDDSAEILDMLRMLCEMEGAQVITALNGQDALAQLYEQDFDILVSDLGMPTMDGYELLMRLRKGTRNSNIPAIALSGYRYSQKAKAVGFTDQLCKPVPTQELLNKIIVLTSRASGHGKDQPGDKTRTHRRRQEDVRR
ncbi:PAS domain S-box protein [Candidimonas sp. SYP-B2681]|uniref:CheR family methyltransferase n=1 Tax=Candidimonas sp. SYP-B2681 TaxID=2497686 RepID=UPI000F871BA6|nr:CheR family methyltransferase [Candidimonas sp. SYP-B2681]RTZ45576.1 PAS domain S-box protein [Candidimonas sp. SYP-B2681]